jgi:hypothetical protein
MGRAAGEHAPMDKRAGNGHHEWGLCGGKQVRYRFSDHGGAVTSARPPARDSIRRRDDGKGGRPLGPRGSVNTGAVDEAGPLR